MKEVLIGIIIGFLIGFLISFIYFLIKLKKQRSNAIEKSKSIILGQVNEKIAPLLPNFNYIFDDMVFLGKGIDYLIFDGLANGNLKQIIFLEIKSNKSNLNKNEKLIKNVIEKGKIKYEIMKI